MNSLIQGLTNPLTSAETKKEKITLLADYLSSTVGRNNLYAIKFLSCEALNIFNAIMNISFLNNLMGGQFYSYGSEVLWFSQKNQEDRTDPMIKVFPRITKCTFNLYGPSGTIETIDLMCVLAMNIFNEKIYIFLWFWFIFLAVVSSMALLYRFIVLFTPNIRVGLLHRKVKFRNKDIGDFFNNKLTFGDFFLLHLLSKNIEYLSFSSLVHAFHARIKPGECKSPDIEPSSPPDHYGLLNSRV